MITSRPRVPETITIKIEPEPLLPSKRKYVAYFEDGTPMYLAAETLPALKERVSLYHPVKDFQLEEETTDA